jgi:hypothetical protein
MTVTVDQLMALYRGHSSPLLGDEQLSLHGDTNARYGLGTLMLSEPMPASMQSTLSARHATSNRIRHQG